MADESWLSDRRWTGIEPRFHGSQPGARRVATNACWAASSMDHTGAAVDWAARHLPRKREPTVRV